jgi:hypothetical protein
MNVQERREIRELTAQEIEVASGGGFLSPFLKAWTKPVELECEQDPTGRGTTIGNCLIV